MADNNVPAKVVLWGKLVGAVIWDEDNETALFQYDPLFVRGGLDPAPLQMPISTGADIVHSFRSLNRETFLGLPGMLADALPDKYGNSLLDAWLVRNGRTKSSFTPVDRLCYTGSRGMGALEFEPAIKRAPAEAEIAVTELVEIAADMMRHRSSLETYFGTLDEDKFKAVDTILRVGTSAGGARAKAVIAMNDKGEVRSGQVPPDKGFEHWILKFDGVEDLELGKTAGYGRIEYAYHLMALAAGINMSECRLLEENGRAHFMTRRFDRPKADKKLHMQSLCGLNHMDYNMAGAYGYEQAMMTIQKLGLDKRTMRELYRRMIFNVMAMNRDDHTKNISFLMDEDGTWSLSPAYDITYAHKPDSEWVNAHQMSINGKRDKFTMEDLLAPARLVRLKKPEEIIEEVRDAVRRFPEFSEKAQVPEEKLDFIWANLNTDVPDG